MHLCLGSTFSLISTRKPSLMSLPRFPRPGQACHRGSCCPKHPPATALDVVLQLSVTYLTLPLDQKAPEGSGRLEMSSDSQEASQSMAQGRLHSRWSVDLGPLVSHILIIPIMAVLGGAPAGRLSVVPVACVGSALSLTNLTPLSVAAESHLS